MPGSWALNTTITPAPPKTSGKRILEIAGRKHRAGLSSVRIFLAIAAATSFALCLQSN